MNVLVLGGRIIGPALADELVQAFVGARFTAEERHARRLAKIKALEDRFRQPRAFTQGEGRHEQPKSRPRRGESARRAPSYGQSVWLDFIRRSLIAQRRAARAWSTTTGSAASPRTRPSSRRRSPAATTTDRDRRALARRARPRRQGDLRAARDRGHPGRGRRAAPGLRPHEGADGYVSLEVSPDLAHDTAGHARRGAPALEGAWAGPT